MCNNWRAAKAECGIDERGVRGCGDDEKGVRGCGDDEKGVRGCGDDEKGVRGCGDDEKGDSEAEVGRGSSFFGAVSPTRAPQAMS